MMTSKNSLGQHLNEKGETLCAYCHKQTKSHSLISSKRVEETWLCLACKVTDDARITDTKSQ